MQLGSPIEAVSAAVYHAAHLAFPDIHYQDRDWAAMRDLTPEMRRRMQDNNEYPTIAKVRRPDVSEIEVMAMFAQTWGSTALGFGGIGGAAMTPAYTVVVTGPGGQLGVYWASRLAYTIDLNAISQEQRANVDADIARKLTASVSQAEARYGAVSLRPKRQTKTAVAPASTPKAGSGKPPSKTAVTKPRAGVILLGKAQ